MFADTISFDTPYGPAHVVYRAPNKWEDKKKPDVSQVVVQCPDYIVWDNSTGKWWPEPQVVDYVLPRARAICSVLGIPEFRWLKIRRNDVWAIEEEFVFGLPIGAMMEHQNQQTAKMGKI